MAQVTLKINGYGYPMGCADGEEPHLLAMAEEVEKRVNKAKALGSQSGEARLLVMAALMMADELHDQALEMKAGSSGRTVAEEKARSERMRRLAAKAERIAGTMEGVAEAP